MLRYPTRDDGDYQGKYHNIHMTPIWNFKNETLSSSRLIILLLLAVVQEKWDRVTQEPDRRHPNAVEIEGDRRRTSMLVINVLDWTHYFGALSDFVLTIVTTMVEDFRPAVPNRADRPRGKRIKFEEGCLCQVI